MSWTVELGGKSWEIPPLPWRAVKAIQPVLMRVWNASGGGANFASLAEADLDHMADCMWRATQHAIDGEKLSREAFDDLAFAFADLSKALAAVMQASGLRKASVDEAPDEGKASTGQA